MFQEPLVSCLAFAIQVFFLWLISKQNITFSYITNNYFSKSISPNERPKEAVILCYIKSLKANDCNLIWLSNVLVTVTQPFISMWFGGNWVFMGYMKKSNLVKRQMLIQSFENPIRHLKFLYFVIHFNTVVILLNKAIYMGIICFPYLILVFQLYSCLKLIESVTFVHSCGTFICNVITKLEIQIVKNMLQV